MTSTEHAVRERALYEARDDDRRFDWAQNSLGFLQLELLREIAHGQNIQDVKLGEKLARWRGDVI
ncbi:Uncharacterised protein [Mycobacteroides abscessus subsp. abscessus]|nr:Uncharacterised protein [Mycobacteroides abscessus subsp. abscessus]